MAQQVAIAGAVFNDVPYIQCPDANNVLHSFYDTAIASNAAAAGDIAQGKLAYVNGSLLTGTNQGGLIYETGTWTPAQDIADYTIPFTNTHTKAPFYYMISDVTGNFVGVANSIIYYVVSSAGSIFNDKFYVNSTDKYFARILFIYASSTTSSSTGGYYLNESNVDSYLKTNGIRTYANSASRLWRANRTYKWIAVWAPTS